MWIRVCQLTRADEDAKAEKPGKLAPADHVSTGFRCPLMNRTCSTDLRTEWETSLGNLDDKDRILGSHCTQEHGFPFDEARDCCLQKPVHLQKIRALEHLDERRFVHNLCLTGVDILEACSEAGRRERDAVRLCAVAVRPRSRPGLEVLAGAHENDRMRRDGWAVRWLQLHVAALSGAELLDNVGLLVVTSAEEDGSRGRRGGGHITYADRLAAREAALLRGLPVPLLGDGEQQSGSAARDGARARARVRVRACGCCMRVLMARWSLLQLQSRC